MTLLSGHCLSQKDSICFSVDEAKIIFQYANKGRYFDTLFTSYESQINDLKEVVQYKTAQIEIGGELVYKQRVLIDDLTVKLAESERKRTNLKRLLFVFGSAVLVETVIILL